MTASSTPASSTPTMDFGSDIVLLFVPGPTYRALSDAAAERNLTVAQLMSAAIDAYLGKPKLLTETSK